MMPFSMLQRGEQAEILMIQGGFRVQQRLESMGFVPGARIEMVTNQFDGPVIIKVKDSRVAVGRGMLHHILVSADRPSDDNRIEPQIRIQRRLRKHHFQ